MKEWSIARRDFLRVVGGALAATTWAGTRVAVGASPGSLTIQQVIDVIVAACPPAPLGTVDTFKAGDPGQPVKGIATTFLATCEVIERCRDKGANLIITHEPTFYSHTDEVDWLREDPVYQHKVRLLKEGGIAVWRFHDLWHRLEPDPVTEGLLIDLGLDGSQSEDGSNIRVIPPVPLDRLAGSLREKLGLSLVRVIGDPNLECRRIALLPGAWGGRGQIGELERHRPDVLICGEINEWETNIYVKDSIASGIGAGLVILGHVNTEEAGMRVLVDWLKPRLPGVPITHVPMGDPFRYLHG